MKGLFALLLLLSLPTHFFVKLMISFLFVHKSALGGAQREQKKKNTLTSALAGLLTCFVRVPSQGSALRISEIWTEMVQLRAPPPRSE